jgi:hypothetical protein
MHARTSKCSVCCVADQVFRSEMMAALQPVLQSQSNGYFIDSCVVHTETCGDSWYGFLVNGVSMAESFSNWYTASGGPTQLLDKAPIAWDGHGNPTCTVSVGGWCVAPVV